MIVKDTIYIDGSWVPSTSPGTLPVINSTTEEVMGTVPQGTPEDVDKAVAAARKAFPAWARISVEERAKFCSFAYRWKASRPAWTRSPPWSARKSGWSSRSAWPCRPGYR